MKKEELPAENKEEVKKDTQNNPNEDNKSEMKNKLVANKNEDVKEDQDKELVKYYSIYKVKSIVDPPAKVNNIVHCPGSSYDFDTDGAYVIITKYL